MKQLISLMALLLISKNGKTTNLEIKNGLRKLFDPSGTGQDFKLTQYEVHMAMNDIAVEESLTFNLAYSAEGHEYREWVKSQSSTADDSLNGDDTSTDDLSDDDILKGGSLAVSNTGSLNTVPATTMPVTSTPPAPLEPGELDEAMGEVTGYWSKDPKVVMQSNTKTGLQKEMLTALKAQHPDMKYDDIRLCSTAFYNKKGLGK